MMDHGNYIVRAPPVVTRRPSRGVQASTSLLIKRSSVAHFNKNNIDTNSNVMMQDGKMYMLVETKSKVSVPSVLLFSRVQISHGRIGQIPNMKNSHQKVSGIPMMDAKLSAPT